MDREQALKIADRVMDRVEQDRGFNRDAVADEIIAALALGQSPAVQHRISIAPLAGVETNISISESGLVQFHGWSINCHGGPVPEFDVLIDSILAYVATVARQQVEDAA